MKEPSTAAAKRGALHWIIVLVVFSLAGSGITRIAPLILKDLLGLQGGFIDGPWSYRLLYLALIPPIYSVLLVTIGTLFGKHYYFRARAMKLWGRLLPGPVGRKLKQAGLEAAKRG